MKRVVCLLMFLACLGWIACGIALGGNVGEGFRHWDFWATLGALFSGIGVFD